MKESGVVFDCGQLVIDNEIARIVKYAVKGFGVSDETLLVDDIHEVGSGGNFLAMDSTLALMRGQSIPGLIDRSVFEEWKLAGRPDMYTQACEKARTILADHKPEPLDPDIAKQLRRIVADADREVAHVTV